MDEQETPRHDQLEQRVTAIETHLGIGDSAEADTEAETADDNEETT